MSVASEFAVADGGDNARDFALQAAQQIGRREIFDHGEAVAPIARFDGVEINGVFHRIFLRDFAFLLYSRRRVLQGIGEINDDRIAHLFPQKNPHCQKPNFPRRQTPDKTRSE